MLAANALLLIGAMVGGLSIGCGDVHAQPTSEARAALAPGGSLRVGLYEGNPLSVVRDPRSPEMRGVGLELGRELARRLQVPFEPVIYPSIAALFDDARSGRWDVSLFVISPGRMKDVEFTPPLLELELGYLAPAGSPLTSASEADRPGIRIAVAEKGQADVILSRTLKQATIVRAAGLAAGLEVLRSGQADAFAANKAILFELSERLPGARILDGRFSVEHIALAVPRERPSAAAYVRAFVQDAKASGLVKAAIERAGARGVVVAPLQ